MIMIAQRFRMNGLGLWFAVLRSAMPHRRDLRV